MNTHRPLALTALVAALLLAAASPAAAQFNCIPSCDPTDSRALVIASGGDLVTLSDPVIDLQIQVPAGTTSFELGIFDGDGNELAPTGFGFDDSFWDAGTGPAEFTYTLYADPEADGVVDPPAVPTDVKIDLNGSLPGESVLSTGMTNNDWCCDDVTSPSPDSNFLVPTGSEALTPSGHYFYTLRIELTDPTPPTAISHSFKVRTSAVASIEPFAQPFSYIARWNSFFGDVLIVYPDSFVSLSPFILDFRDMPTTYNGDFSFLFTVAAEREELDIWDGDFDHGRYDCPVRNEPPNPACGVNDADTDDLDTPNTENDWPSNPFPAWNTEDGTAEGIAAGTLENANLTGSPPDDTVPVSDLTGIGNFGRWRQRSPSVAYDLIVPDGREFINLNPSGNREWEQYIISSHPDCDASSSCVPNGDPGDRPGFPCSDACTASPLPPGIYQLRIRGVDMQNLNAIRLPERVVCVGESGGACASLAPYLLGDTIFRDQYGGGGTIAGDGFQQAGEPGINGVLVNLYNAAGAYAGTTITANDGVEDGRYSFGVVAGEYTVEVAGENFFAPTAGPVGAVGDRVWYDVDGDNNALDEGEPGIAGVRLRLWDDGGDGPGGGNDAIIASTRTDRNGEYLFTGLADGTYFVTVDGSTLPDGLAFAGGTGVDGLGDPAVATISGGNQVLTLDFGYGLADAGQAFLGDFVWSDADGDGFQDPEEAGIAGVRIEICTPNCTDPTEVTSTFTGADGTYSFVLDPDVGGTPYEVRVADTAGVLSGYTQTGDPDFPGVTCVGLQCDGAQSVTVSPGDLVPTVDFGFSNPALSDLSDIVWLDIALRDGAFGAGQESGIPGVTVNLLRGGEVIATAVTDLNGAFTFADLPAGDYRLVITDLGGEINGLLPTTSAALAGGLVVTLDGTASVTGESFGYAGSGALEGLAGTTIKSPVGDFNRQVDTVVNANVFTYDFGYAASGSIGDRVWYDVDGDGVQDPDEPGIAGVTVTLFNPDTGVTLETTTDADGNYLFAGLSANDGYVVSVDAGTLPAGFDTPTFDLDGTGTANTATVSLGLGDHRTDADFGYTGSYLIGDTVFEDSLIVNGSQDPGEPGIPGVVVYLLDAGHHVIGSTLTDANGNYFFRVVPGTYTVQIAGENFGDGRGAVGDLVWVDDDRDGIEDAGEPGFGSVTVWLYDAGPDGMRGGGDDVLIDATVTGMDGGYLFAGLPPGTYYTEVDATTVPAGLDAVSGLGFSDTRTILADGSCFEASCLDLDFGYDNVSTVTAVIGDFVWSDADGDGTQDAGEPGIGGVTIDLVDLGDVGDPFDDVVVATATTAADGSYLFTGVAPGTYSFVVTDLGGVLATYTLTYSLDGPPSPTALVTVAGGDVILTADFGYQSHVDLPSISDFVWLDTDGDGFKDAGEAGIGGVTVSLIGPSGEVVATAVTAGDGSFSFPDLADGSYTVLVTDTGGVLAGKVATTDGALQGLVPVVVAGFDVTAESFGYNDFGVLEGSEGTTIKAPNDNVDEQIDTVFKESILTYDFGYASGSIGDRVWVDNDRDGLFEPNLGELGLNGVVVKLYDTVTGELLATTTTVTDGDGLGGYYLFERVVSGDYTVVVEQPAGYFQVSDPDGVLDNRHRHVLAVGEDYLAADFGYLLIHQPGVGTPGYWKNHPEAWPVDFITIGGVTYSKAEAIKLIQRSNQIDGEGKEKEYTLFRALVSAKLNAMIGNDTTCISQVIADADAWIADYPLYGPPDVNANSRAWKIGEPLYWQLDRYNNTGGVCADPRH